VVGAVGESRAGTVVPRILRLLPGAVLGSRRRRSRGEHACSYRPLPLSNSMPA